MPEIGISQETRTSSPTYGRYQVRRALVQQEEQTEEKFRAHSCILGPTWDLLGLGTALGTWDIRRRALLTVVPGTNVLLRQEKTPFITELC